MESINGVKESLNSIKDSLNDNVKDEKIRETERTVNSQLEKKKKNRKKR